MKFLKICFLLLMFTGVVFSQNIDSLFNEYLHLHGIEDPGKLPQTESEKPGRKCGFGLAQQIRSNYNSLTAAQQRQFDILAYRPDLQKSIVSPSGNFRIHYDTTGINVPAYDILETAEAFDSSYNYEVVKLGYPPHISDGSLGGGPELDVYLRKLGSNEYGVTDWDNNGAAYITVNSDFDGNHYTKGIDAARVTAAHEYHHAIQVGNYNFFSSERYYYELTSTSMEEFVFDDIDDYRGYLNSYFFFPNRDIASYDGYEIAIWNIFLKEKFEKEGNPQKGFDIIKKSWEIFSEEGVAISSINQALFESGTSFKNEFASFGLWCYFTDYRANPELYFEEGINYPQLYIREYNDFSPPKTKYELRALEPASNYFMDFRLITESSLDTLITIITNHDINSSGATFPVTISADYYLLTEQEPDANNIVNNYHSIIESDKSSFLMESNIFNNIIVSGDTIERMTEDYAFPQPFRYSDISIFIPVENNNLGFADLNIYTVGMDLVYQGRKNIIAGEKIVVRWDGKDSDGNKLPTGVYIYATSSDDNIVTGKLIIYND